MGALKPISSTAFYCCGVRMEDAASRAPVCGDMYAKRFMDDAALRIFERFREFTPPNRSNAARHRIVDDLLRERLVHDPDTNVALIGCGFDSRAYRLGGGRWFELDEPEVIAYKNECLPISQCPNPLQRIPIDFAAESLEAKLASPGCRGNGRGGRRRWCSCISRPSSSSSSCRHCAMSGPRTR